jgi:hypothetical protein
MFTRNVLWMLDVVVTPEIPVVRRQAGESRV